MPPAMPRAVAAHDVCARATISTLLSDIDEQLAQLPESVLLYVDERGKRVEVKIDKDGLRAAKDKVLRKMDRNSIFPFFPTIWDADRRLPGDGLKGVSKELHEVLIHTLLALREMTGVLMHVSQIAPSDQSTAAIEHIDEILENLKTSIDQSKHGKGKFSSAKSRRRFGTLLGLGGATLSLVSAVISFSVGVCPILAIVLAAVGVVVSILAWHRTHWCHRQEPLRTALESFADGLIETCRDLRDGVHVANGKRLESRMNMLTLQQAEIATQSDSRMRVMMTTILKFQEAYQHHETKMDERATSMSLVDAALMDLQQTVNANASADLQLANRVARLERELNIEARAEAHALFWAAPYVTVTHPHLKNRVSRHDHQRCFSELHGTLV
jgi:hypothetical protein